MKSCFGYLRVSTQKQGEGVSLEAQKDAITVFASQNNLSVIKWFEERETAAKRGRPIFNQMLRQLKSGQASGLIMHKIDRSARNLRDWALVSELPNLGIDIFFATESLDFRSRGGRLAANLQAVIAEDYIFNLREECIKGMTGRLKQGLFPWGAPPGYLNCGGGKPKVPCPKTAPLIKQLFELYATRQYSYETLLEEMHRCGLRNTRGGKLTLCGLGNILKNPFYIGLIYIKSSGETYAGIHEPIVPVATWKRVQDIRGERSGPKSTRHNHLFQGIFRCGLCGNPMVPEKQKGHVYYRCKRTSCLTKTIREDVLDVAIRTELQHLVLNARAYAKAETEKMPDTIVTLEEQRSALKLTIAGEERRLERLEDLLIDETLSPEVFKRKRQAAQLRIAGLNEELEKIPDPADRDAHLKQLAELRKSLISLYENANRAEKRVIIENVWPNRVVSQKTPAFEPYSWVERVENDAALLCGALERHRGRTIHDIDQSNMELIRPLLNMLNRYSSQ
jgi:DNA invertase Pin-like site-specific DNA recombinase